MRISVPTASDELELMNERVTKQDRKRDRRRHREVTLRGARDPKRTPKTEENVEPDALDDGFAERSTSTKPE